MVQHDDLWNQNNFKIGFLAAKWLIPRLLRLLGLDSTYLNTALQNLNITRGLISNIPDQSNHKVMRSSIKALITPRTVYNVGPSAYAGIWLVPLPLLVPANFMPGPLPCLIYQHSQLPGSSCLHWLIDGMGPKAKISAGGAFLIGTQQPAILEMMCCEADNCNKFWRLLPNSNPNAAFMWLDKQEEDSGG